MSKKVLAIVLGVVAVTAGAAMLYLLPRNASIVTSTSGFLSSSYHFYDANSILKVKVPFSRVNEDTINDLKAKNEKELNEALETVADYDGSVFRSEYTSPSSLVYVLGDNIYYFRTDSTDCVYRLNVKEHEIAACPLSGYNGFTDTSLQKGYTEVDHNFTTFVSIKTEALIDAYPGLRGAIDSVDGIFYHNCLFYDNGSVFFEKKNTIYEYLPDSDSVRKIVTVGSGENVEFVLDR